MGSNLLYCPQKIPDRPQIFPLGRGHPGCDLFENRSIGIFRRNYQKSALTKPLGHGLREPFKLGSHHAVGMYNVESNLRIIAVDRISCLRENLLGCPGRTAVP